MEVDATSEVQATKSKPRKVPVKWRADHCGSIIFLTFFQAQITSDLTAQKLQGEINSISDLNGKNVISIPIWMFIGLNLV